MNLKYITCSDPREFNDIHEIVCLGKISPRVEIAVQAHPSKMSPGMPRNEWFRELLQFIKRDRVNINLAVHVNREWCDEICRKGIIPAELKEFFNMSHNEYWPLIKRWQLNVPLETVENADINALSTLFRLHRSKDFIVQYNTNTYEMVNKLYKTSASFSLLYDASGGRGISPTEWCPPVFMAVPQGYSGGLSPENVDSNLTQISNVVKWTPRCNECWIDAEGKLKTADKFDVVRARQYVINAENWLINQKQR